MLSVCQGGGGEMLVVVKVVFLCLFAAVSWTCVRMEGRGKRKERGKEELMKEEVLTKESSCCWLASYNHIAFSLFL